MCGLPPTNFCSCIRLFCTYIIVCFYYILHLQQKYIIRVLFVIYLIAVFLLLQPQFLVGFEPTGQATRLSE